ncbi:MAG: YitT family protein [Clostridiales bacterium]|nr:YitT family protein [Clostridiales bacterium]MBR5182350.1 YitT family protein [Clostridiales bacterium]
MNKLFKQWIVPLFFITVGAVIAAFALEEFLVPFTVLDGGVVGISMIISQLSGLPLGVLTIVLNVPFVLLGFKRLGMRFLVKAIYAMVIFSVFLSVFKDMKAVTDKEILVVAFGGVLLGIGVGLILRYGGCLDGTEIVAMFLSKNTEFSVGQIVLFFNIIIYGIAGFLFGPDRALYSLLTYFITSKIIDIVENGMEQGKSVMIITDHGKDIADAIYTQLGRTCTQMEGKGMVSNGKKTVLYCVITRVEVPAIKKIINDADVSAFMTISDVSEIVGNHIKRKKAPVRKAPARSK